MIKAGIIGGTGLVAGELLRLLVNHNQVDIDFVYSNSSAGKKISTFHHDLLGQLDIEFTNKVNLNADVVFLCLGHGNSTEFLKQNKFSDTTKIIDLSNDFRLKNNAVFEGKKFIYGLPELNYEQIKTANYIANPGCFATAIQTALLPLAKKNLLNNDVHIHAITGATGAGRTLSETTSFNWRNNNISVYKSFTHQHLGEITESVKSLQSDFNNDINFVPMRGDFTRGIFASVYMKTNIDENLIQQYFNDFYKDARFTHISNEAISLKQVVNTNNCLVNISTYDNIVHITTAIDNLLKGASGQAVHNMNLMFGFNEEAGLRLKAVAF